MSDKEVKFSDSLYEEYFQKVKIILKRKPNYSMRQVSMAAGVPREYIEKYIEDGLLIMKDGRMGEAGTEEKIEQDRRSQLIESFKEQLRIDAEKQSGNSSSQLVRDLNQRKKMSEEGREK